MWKRFRNLALFGLLLLVLTMISLAAYLRSDEGTIKMVMPGDYSLSLDKGLYSVWYFWKWPSKGVDVSQEIPEIVIVDSLGKKIKMLPEGTISFPGNTSGHNKGILKEHFVVMSQQRVSVRSSTKCIVAIVPDKAVFNDMGAYSFRGCDNDNNFIKPN